MGADPNITTAEGSAPILVAAQLGNLAALKYLLEIKCDVNVRTLDKGL